MSKASDVPLVCCECGSILSTWELVHCLLNVGLRIHVNDISASQRKQIQLRSHISVSHGEQMSKDSILPITLHVSYILIRLNRMLKIF